MVIKPISLPSDVSSEMSNRLYSNLRLSQGDETEQRQDNFLSLLLRSLIKDDVLYKLDASDVVFIISGKFIRLVCLGMTGAI